MDPALRRVVVASREFQNVDDLMTDVANGGCARLLAVWALAMRTNRRLGRSLHGCCLPMEYGRSPVGTLFSQINCYACGDFRERWQRLMHSPRMYQYLFH